MFISQKEDKTTEIIVRFLTEIGIEVRAGEIVNNTFLPGIDVAGGTLVIDESKLLYPGDLLHEAGHLAVMTPGERAKAGTTIDTGPGEEMAVIAWSYAAALYLELDPAIVFHPDGYKGDSNMILENFAGRRYFGVPLLQWMGMTVEKNTTKSEVELYPKMSKWLRD